MFSVKDPGEFKKEVTVDYLFSTYRDHQRVVEELAMNEIHSLELAMPRFNTLASLNKTDFNKFMRDLRKKHCDDKALTVLVAAIADTLTCVIKNSKFYEHFADDNKNSLSLLMDLLLNVQYFTCTTNGIKGNQLETLIALLEKSATRIQFDENYYKRMMEIIKRLKKQAEYQTGKENKMDYDFQEPKPKHEVAKFTKPQLQIRKDLFKTPAPTQTTKKYDKPLMLENNKLVTAMLNMLDTDAVIDTDQFGKQNLLSNSKPSITTKKTIKKCELVDKTMKKMIVTAVPLKSHNNNNNNKPANAFELMMKSSKLLSKKK